ncbi:MAG TPA: hypothetical protein VKT72_12695 [Candidatus Baltobacteraceae bacterium]|nr:hypothetical protein [Candidatus Baltobacteraceae bacterium]
MILEPSKSAEEIERRLSAIRDPELAELLKSFKREPSPSDAPSYTEPDDYSSPYAPYWKRRIGFIALAGLLAMSVGYGYNSATSHPGSQTKPLRAAALVPPRAHRKVAVRHSVAPATSVQHHAAVVPARAPAPAPDEAMIRQVRAQLVHQRTLAVQAQADAARAHYQAKLAMQARAQAQERALESALAQARAEALAAARAEALSREQAESALQRQQEQAEVNAQDPQIKPGDEPPASTGRVSTYPNPSNPAPMPGPVMDPNCTPHRGSLFQNILTSAAIYEVQRIIH